MTETEANMGTSAGGKGSESRVSTLVGDRLCIRCHYNLCGQPIVREGHYNMLIVRCPECATVASLQEHPLLGRWATRWAVVFAGLWLVVLLVAALVTGSMLYGISLNIGKRASHPYVDQILELQKAWQAENEQSGNPTWRPSFSIYESRLDSAWWNTQDKNELLEDAGGWIDVADWSVLWQLPFMAPFVVLAGFVWALLMPQVRRLLLPLYSLGLFAVPLFFVLVAEIDTLFGPAWSIGDTVFPQVGMKVQIVALLLMTIPLSIGMLLGRTVARLLVRALLPPRMRGSLAGLWFIDGLQPPAGTRVVRR